MQEILPLEGIKILDFTRLLPGPLGTHMLSQMGAEVMKIESPKRMDYTRYYQPQIKGVSTLFHTLNHTKKQLIIDYETSEGYQQIVEEIKLADVLVEQFRPGAMESFNLSFDTVKKINPNIVYISVTGYGQSGDKKEAAGHDLNYMAETGLLSMNRDEQGKPVLPGFQLADIAGGSFMLVSACTSGLLAQRLRKTPQYIDVSLFDATLALGAIAQGMLQGKADYNQMPFLSGGLVNYNVYECSDKKWIALGALELKFWNSFCDMVQRPLWKTSDISTLVTDFFDKNQLEELFKTKTRDEWVVMASSFDVCLSPVLEVKEVYEQKHTKDRAVFKEIKIDEEQIYIYDKPYKNYMD
ncbi:Crotonobetainyl-CoA:carnitine CoA-transferase CaiB [Flavobacterium gillisiae]|uniref:Crotonobetainyl-CoA:carnitine CoA-transferase CaiB n=1 Tax=Flavobacterium gillisiae TaxID=150146 RepID=A0A1H4ASI6_9FLAO|nr:CaiB/BaiF CoA-transferase family protein [Flavobacterium gillisiae]SEA38859.1 Crotonobetainyl-CoA:carnitine CoA-transferase CaiB [Flavobacterium gillisiae]